MSGPLARRRGICTDSIGDELVVFDRTHDAIWSLDPRMALLWRRCDGRAGLDELVDAVRRESDPPASRSVVRAALKRLASASLLEGRRRPPRRMVRSSVRHSSALRQGLNWPGTKGASPDGDAESALDI